MNELNLDMINDADADTHITVSAEDGGEYDVIVVGAGLSGVCAAVAAARTGARTLLAEALPFVGGNGTMGLPISSLRARNSEQMIVGGLVVEIVERLIKRGGADANYMNEDWISIDPEQLQLVLADLLRETEIDLLTYSPLIAVDKHSDRINTVSFYNKDGRALRYHARTFVDSTGDAQLAHLAGLPTPMGRQRDGRTQTLSLVFAVAGVDESRAPTQSLVGEAWRRYQVGNGSMNSRSAPAINEVAGRAGWRSIIATRIELKKGTDNRLLAEAEIEGRQQIEEFLYGFLRPHVPGYEDCYLAQLASHVGVRETRRITGLYEITADDLISGRRFKDAIACNANSIEIHLPESGKTYWNHLEDETYFTIPYRAIVADGVENLFASGRCISASHEALAALRVLSPAMATGQAAGTAAALAASSKTAAGELDPELLRAKLRDAGAIVD